jgi:hypothetical protein
MVQILKLDAVAGQVGKKVVFSQHVALWVLILSLLTSFEGRGLLAEPALAAVVSAVLPLFLVVNLLVRAGSLLLVVGVGGALRRFLFLRVPPVPDILSSQATKDVKLKTLDNPNRKLPKIL